MKQRIQLLFLLYGCIAVCDVLFIYFNYPTLRWFTKPLLMPLLAAAFYVATVNKKGRMFWFILAALFLSWAGDLFLQMNNLFIPGLISFLLAHVFYILYFLSIHPGKKGLFQFQPLIGLPVLIYIVLFLYFLYPFLDALKIPVTVYGITIGSMLLMSLHVRRKTSDAAATYFFTGAFLFVISDSVLAVNLFAVKHVLLSLCVMITYASAQYFIVKGTLQHQQDLFL